MSRSLNKIMIIGNTGSDPEIRSTSTGTRIAKFSIATSRKWTGKDGNSNEKTEWHHCTVWGRLVDIVEEYVRKGDRLYVEGSIEYSTTGEGDAKRYYTDIQVWELIMLGNDSKLKAQAHEQATGPITAPDDDLPF